MHLASGVVFRLVLVLKNKLQNTWDVMFAAEGILQLIACDIQETNEK